jgi:hypothetical protein
MGTLKRVPVIGKDLFKDTPVPRGCCQHLRPPREGLGIVAVPWLYHVSCALSIPPQRSQCILLHRCGNCIQINHKKCNFLCYGLNQQSRSWRGLSSSLLDGRVARSRAHPIR